MRKKDIPAHGGSRERERAEKAALAGTSPFRPQNTTTGGLIASILSGRDNPLTCQEIMSALSLSDPRVVTKLIEQERRSGLPICASNDSKRPGYYLAETPGELESYTRSLRRRVKAVSGTLAALEATHDTWTGQQRLDLDDLEGGESE
jgi:hypothetical protein